MSKYVGRLSANLSAEKSLEMPPSQNTDSSSRKAKIKVFGHEFIKANLGTLPQYFSKLSKLECMHVSSMATFLSITVALRK